MEPTESDAGSSACTIADEKSLSQQPKYADLSVRFDVVAFNRAKDDNCELQWVKDAFRPE